ncbi:MAG: hypothetical protein ACKO2L_11460 [Planctomycetaceae bacterium]
MTLQARAPSVRNVAGGCRPTAGSKRNLSRMAAACGQMAPANALPPTSPARAPSVRNIAGGSRPTAGSKRYLSRMAAACGRRTLQRTQEQH